MLNWLSWVFYNPEMHHDILQSNLSDIGSMPQVLNTLTQYHLNYSGEYHDASQDYRVPEASFSM